MKKMQNYIPLSMLVVGAFSTLPSCVDAGESLRILRNQAPEDGCSVPGDQGAAFLSQGIIDVGADTGYIFTPLVENRAVANGSTDRRVFVDAAVVRLSFDDRTLNAATISAIEAANLDFFRQPFSGSIEAGGTGAFAFEVISKQALDLISDGLLDTTTRVTAEIEIRGEVDGSDVASPTFTYPIEVCNGCLTNDLGSCSALPNVEIRTGGTCQTQQDGFVDCCTNSAGTSVCPAVEEVAEE